MHTTILIPDVPSDEPIGMGGEVGVYWTLLYFLFPLHIQLTKLFYSIGCRLILNRKVGR